jgi:ribosomal protein L18E
MTNQIQNMVELCQLIENLNTGHQNTKQINKIWKNIPFPFNNKKLHTKKQKISKIREYFNTVADATIQLYLINKQKPKEDGNIQEDK